MRATRVQMIRFHAVSGLRSLIRYRATLPVAIAGLAAGFAGTILILLLARFEFGFDAAVPGNERIYRVETRFNAPGTAGRVMVSAAPALATTARNSIPGIELVARMEVGGSGEFAVGDHRVNLTVRPADVAFLEMFPQRALVGDLATALDRPEAVILTRSAAGRLFGDWRRAQGSTLVAADGANLAVTAVIEDLAADSHIAADGFAALPGAVSRSGSDLDSAWLMNSVFTYVRLDTPRDPALLEEQLTAMVAEKVPMIATVGRDGGPLFEPVVVPLRDIHMYSTASGQMKPPGNPTLIRSMLIVAAAVMAISLANFAAIQLAILGHRAREVGIRKSLGAGRGDIVLQVLVETSVPVALALVVALAGVALLLPAFADFVDREIDGRHLFEGGLLLQIAALWCAVLLLGAAFPALRIASSGPVPLIVGRAPGSRAGGALRSLTVAAQFAVSGFLIVTTLVVHGQTRLADRFDRGLTFEDRLAINNLGRLDAGRVETLERRIAALPGALATSPAGNFLPNTMRVTVPVSRGGEAATRIDAERMFVGPGFAELFGLDLLAGRWFLPGFAGDALAGDGPGGTGGRGAAVIDETLTRMLGFATPSAAIGERIEATDLAPGIVVGGSERKSALDIVGVVGEAHWGSLREQPAPMLYLTGGVAAVGSGVQSLFVAHAPGAGEAIGAAIGEVWRELVPERPVALASLAAVYDGQAEGERRRATVFGVFSGLAILLSAIGLYGATAFFVQRQEREVALRKLFGASPSGLAVLLGGRFVRPAGLAFLISTPLAWAYNRDWLQDFAIRIEPGPGLYLLALLLAIAVALLTVSGLVARAVRRPPAEALRHD